MKFLRRRAPEVEEGESYYISMTDMMVGVVFIFIIMLSYFALQYRKTTAGLTDAKDVQTAALLQMAGALENQATTIEIDRKAHIVCIPGAALGSDDDRRCFAYTGQAPVHKTTEDTHTQIVAADRAGLMTAIGDDVQAAALPVTVSIDAANLSFPADQIFDPGTARISPSGQPIVQKIALTLATRLPCYAYGVATTSSCGSEAKMAIVNVVTAAQFDAFTAEGRAAAALALQRSVAVHDALVASQPALNQLRTDPDGQPLLQVANYNQSIAQAATSTSGQTVSIEFRMKP